MDRVYYIVLGTAAVLFFLVAAMRSVALRRYRSLLDPDAPQAMTDGCYQGLYGERRTQIGLVPPVHGLSQPAKVQISMESLADLRIEAHTESMAVAVRKAVGIQGDRSLGLDDLDRRFALQFDDRPRTRAVLSHIEARQSLEALADLGGDFILQSNGILVVEIPTPWVLMPRRERVRQVLTAMRTLAEAAESALAIPHPVASWQPDAALARLETWPASTPSGTVVRSPVFLATFFMAMILAVWIVGSFWDFSGTVPWDERLVSVMSRLPHVALAAGAWGLLAALFVPARPLAWAFQVSWPLVVHAAIVGAVYLLLRATGVPEVQQALGAELEMIPAGLGTAAAAAGVGLGSGFAGAALGNRLSRMSL